MDRGDWRAAVHEATRSQTPLSNKATQHIFHSQGEAVVPQGEVPAFKVMSSVWEFFVLFCFFQFIPFSFESHVLKEFLYQANSI